MATQEIQESFERIVNNNQARIASASSVEEAMEVVACLDMAAQNGLALPIWALHLRACVAWINREKAFKERFGARAGECADAIESLMDGNPDDELGQLLQPLLVTLRRLKNGETGPP